MRSHTELGPRPLLLFKLAAPRTEAGPGQKHAQSGKMPFDLLTFSGTACCVTPYRLRRSQDT